MIELVSPFTDAGYEHRFCPHDSIFADNCPTCLRRMYGELWADNARLRKLLDSAGRALRRCDEKAQHRGIHNAEFERAGELAAEIRETLK